MSMDCKHGRVLPPGSEEEAPPPSVESPALCGVSTASCSGPRGPLQAGSHLLKTPSAPVVWTLASSLASSLANVTQNMVEMNWKGRKKEGRLDGRKEGTNGRKIARKAPGLCSTICGLKPFMERNDCSLSTCRVITTPRAEGRSCDRDASASCC
ncbi:hypothetical protein EYF80_060182 [Liparis tanakae]|uniref:Uncharacterized protein n=1 Tax=Liparis tanakae TaxID=230148 RepID=A0A4Z2ELJ5_9TELE|nr:hypothetical protein EYF80_060182 [Liparis tanakae]